MSSRRPSGRPDSDESGPSTRQSIDLNHSPRLSSTGPYTEESLHFPDDLSANESPPVSRIGSFANDRSSPVPPTGSRSRSDLAKFEAESEAGEALRLSTRSRKPSEASSTSPRTPSPTIFDGHQGTPESNFTDPGINDQSPRSAISKDEPLHSTLSQSAFPGSTPMSPNSISPMSPEREPSQPDVPAPPSTIRDRRQQTARERSGRYFRMASNLRKDANLHDLPMQYRRNSQPGYRANVLSPIMPNTAPIDAYGPFRVMFHDSLLSRQQQFDEDLRRIKETRFVQLKDGVVIPRPLLRLIAALKDGRKLTMEDLQEDTLLPATYDDFERALRESGARELSGSELIDEPEPDHSPASPDHPTPSDPKTPHTERIRIQKHLGWVSFYLRFNADIFDREGFRELGWALDGNLQFPTFNFVRTWQVPNLPELGRSALKSVYKPLIFLIKKAAEYGLMPLRSAREMVKKLLEQLRKLHVVKDRVDEACARICRWPNITINEYVPAMPAMPVNRHMVSLTLIAIGATYIGWSLYRRWGQYIPSEDINEAYDGALEGVMGLLPLERGPILRTALYRLALLALLPSICYQMTHFIPWASRPLLALLTKICTGLSTTLPGVFKNMLLRLQDFANNYELGSKLRAVRESLYWLGPFLAIVGALWRWGFFEKFKFYATLLTKYVLDIVEDGFEFVATKIDQIPYGWIRETLLDIWLWVLRSFYVARELVAPFIGYSTVLAALVLAAVVLDETIGKGYFLRFLTRVFNHAKSVFYDLPGNTVRAIEKSYGWIHDFLGFIWIVLTIQFNHLADKVLSAIDLILEQLSYVLSSVVELSQDLWAYLRFTPKEVQAPLQQTRQVSPQQNWLLWAVLRWVFNTLSVALGVWFAMFVCGLCLSCADGSCLNGASKAQGVGAQSSTFSQILAVGFRKQLTAIEQLGHVLLRSSTQHELAVAQRDQMILQKMEDVRQLVENQNGGWSARRMFGFA